VSYAHNGLTCWQHIAELKAVCCPTLLYITKYVYCIKGMHIKHSFIHGFFMHPKIPYFSLQPNSP